MHQSDQILDLTRRRRVLRAADVREQGWSPQLLLSLHQAGKLQRVARGLYSLPDAEITEHQTQIEVCQRVPKAVLCLLSALQLQGIGTQMPYEVWVTLPEATQTPALDYPTLRIARLRCEAYPNFDPSETPATAQRYLCIVWSRIRACLARKGIVVYGMSPNMMEHRTGICWFSMRLNNMTLYVRLLHDTPCKTALKSRVQFNIAARLKPSIGLAALRRDTLPKTLMESM